jgi:predicted metalloprotease with PDZ domain
MKIYWSGAAVALIADVRLREMSGGSESLDKVLDRLQACCLPSDRTWSGEELFARMDSLTEYPIFVALYRRYADTAGFPDTTYVFENLGMTVSDDGKVKLRKHGALRDIRLAIMAPDASAMQWREQLTATRR